MDLLSSVSVLAREVARWTAWCDRRLRKLTSYIHRIKNLVQTSHVGDEPDECLLALHEDVSFAGDLKDFESNSRCFPSLVGPNISTPIS